MRVKSQSLLQEYWKKTSGSLERKITEAVLIQKLKPDLNGQINIVDFVI